jgi:hypothetical protein
LAKKKEKGFHQTQVSHSKRKIFIGKKNSGARDEPIKSGNVCVPGLPDFFKFLFSNQKSQFGKFCRALDWKMLTYFMAIGNILRTFEIFYDTLVHFVFIWYIFYGFGIIHQEKSGNPGVRALPKFGACDSFRFLETKMLRRRNVS